MRPENTNLRTIFLGIGFFFLKALQPIADCIVSDLKCLTRTGIELELQKKKALKLFINS